VPAAEQFTFDSCRRRGRRITKAVTGQQPTVYVYDPTGQLAAEYGRPTDSESSTRYLVRYWFLRR
jgi:hypothetical protein